MKKSILPSGVSPPSRLAQWPCKLRLVPDTAPYLDGAVLLLAADCAAYAYPALHERFMRGAITLIGCPALDGGGYEEKLTAILSKNNIRSIRILRMEVACCGGMELAVRHALAKSGKRIETEAITITTDGIVATSQKTEST